MSDPAGSDPGLRARFLNPSGMSSRARHLAGARAARAAPVSREEGVVASTSAPPVDTSAAGILKAARESNALRRGVAATGSAGAGAAPFAASRFAAASLGASAGSAAGSARAPAPAGMPGPPASRQTYAAAAAAAAGAPAAAAARAQALPVPRALGTVSSVSGLAPRGALGIMAAPPPSLPPPPALARAPSGRVSHGAPAGAWGAAAA